MSRVWETAPKGRVAVALLFIEENWFCWRRVNPFTIVQRSQIAAQAAAVVAHDRILNGELASRGLPSYLVGEHR